MFYPETLTDESDPSYAPNLQWRDATPYWRAPRKYLALGYEPKNVRLEGAKGDGRDLDRAAECRRLTRAMVMRYDPSWKTPPKRWDHLIDRYLEDEESPFHRVRSKTADSYRWLCAKWKPILGAAPIAALDFRTIRSIERSMIAAGRSASYIHRMFTMLRALVSYGRLLKAPGIRDVAEVLSEIRFDMAPKRQVAPTREQVFAVIRHATDSGLNAFALGLSIQWAFALRGVDVFGQWEPARGQGGIIRDGKRWVDGLTWDMVEPEITGFAKVISKTRKSLPEATRHSLEGDSPLERLVREHLARVPVEKRIGPVIVSEASGLPYTTDGRSHAFRRIADEIGLPREITMMDLRAGALTEAQRKGADLMSMRDAAGHLNAATTDRYARGRAESIAKVVQLRG